MNDKTENSIRLDQFLKLCGLFATGGQAKQAIQAGQVLVNDEVEVRRRRKLVVGDVVRFECEVFEVEVESESEPEML